MGCGRREERRGEEDLVGAVVVSLDGLRRVEGKTNRIGRKWAYKFSSDCRVVKIIRKKKVKTSRLSRNSTPPCSIQELSYHSI